MRIFLYHIFLSSFEPFIYASIYIFARFTSFLFNFDLCFVISYEKETIGSIDRIQWQTSDVTKTKKAFTIESRLTGHLLHPLNLVGTLLIRLKISNCKPLRKIYRYYEFIAKIIIAAIVSF